MPKQEVPETLQSFPSLNTFYDDKIPTRFDGFIRPRSTSRPTSVLTLKTAAYDLLREEKQRKKNKNVVLPSPPTSSQSRRYRRKLTMAEIFSRATELKEDTEQIEVTKKKERKRRSARESIDLGEILKDDLKAQTFTGETLREDLREKIYEGIWIPLLPDNDHKPIKAKDLEMNLVKLRDVRAVKEESRVMTRNNSEDELNKDDFYYDIVKYQLEPCSTKDWLSSPLLLDALQKDRPEQKVPVEMHEVFAQCDKGDPLANFSYALNVLSELHSDLRCSPSDHARFWLSATTLSIQNYTSIVSRIAVLNRAKKFLLTILRIAARRPDESDLLVVKTLFAFDSYEGPDEEHEGIDEEFDKRLEKLKENVAGTNNGSVVHHMHSSNSSGNNRSQQGNSSKQETGSVRNDNIPHPVSLILEKQIKLEEEEKKKRIAAANAARALPVLATMWADSLPWTVNEFIFGDEVYLNRGRQSSGGVTTQGGVQGRWGNVMAALKSPQLKEIMNS